jgi:hypothetical protein
VDVRGGPLGQGVDDKAVLRCANARLRSRKEKEDFHASRVIASITFPRRRKSKDLLSSAYVGRLTEKMQGFGAIGEAQGSLLGPACR